MQCAALSMIMAGCSPSVSAARRIVYGEWRMANRRLGSLSCPSALPPSRVLSPARLFSYYRLLPHQGVRIMMRRVFLSVAIALSLTAAAHAQSQTAALQFGVGLFQPDREKNDATYRPLAD